MLNLLRNTVSNFRLTKAKQDANNFLAAAGITGQVQSQAIYNLVNDLQTSGLWSKMKAVYPMVTDNYNLFSYTQDTTNAYWGKNNLTLTQNVANPFGANTAYLMTENSSSGYHVMYSGVVATTALSTYSCYLKSNGRQWAWLSDNAGGVYFDLVNGVVGTASGGRAGSITNIGNGWYRCVVSNNAISGGNQYYISLSLNGADSGNYTGNGTSGIYVYGNQLEYGSTASTYQPILTTPSAFMASQMKYNLKDARDLDAAFRLTWSGGWTYSATGATPNGTNAYADTKLASSAVLNLSSTHISYYSRTNNALAEAEMGSWTTGYTTGIELALNRSGQTYTVINSAGGAASANTSGQNSQAFFISNRPSASSLKYYRNNVLLVQNTTSPTLAAPTSNIFIGSSSKAGVAEVYSTKQCSFSTIGDGLTDQETLLLNQIVEKYQVALSRGVQAAQSFYYNSAYSNESNTYLYSTQITGTTQVSAINTLINGLKANNLWTKMKAVYPFVTDKYNYLGYTEDVANAVWGKNPNATFSANTTTSPDGTLTADTIGNSGGVATSIYQLGVSASNSFSYTASIYIKQKTNRYFKLVLTGATSGNQRYGVVFDMSNGTVINELNTSTQLTNKSYSITDAGNGWYRVSVTATVPTTSDVYLTIESTNSTSTSYNTANLDYINATAGECYIWGAQIQLGSLTAYQPILGANNYATNVAAQMKFNLVNPQDTDAAFRLAFSGGWTYSTNGAFTNGVNAYADTKLNPGTVYGSGYAAFGAYWRNNFGSGQTNIIGSTDGSNRFDLGYDVGVTTPFVATGNASSSTGTDTSSLGLVLATRQGATSNKLFRNNVNKINGLLSFSANPSFNFYLGGRNNGGATQLFNNNQEYAFAFLSTFLNDAEVALLTQLVTDYQTQLSRQVI